MSEPEASCRQESEMIPGVPQEGLAAWGPGECGVQAEALSEKDVSRKGFVRIHRVWSEGQAGQLPC